MERGNGRYNNYNHNRRSCGHQASGQPSSNNNQHTENLNHHHHNQSSSHHHRSGATLSSVGVSSLPNSTIGNPSQLQLHSNNGFKLVSMQNAFGRDSLTHHDELIRYINEAWIKVNEHGNSVIYRNDSDQLLKNFKPFNLEEYWGQRLVQNIHVSHNHQ